MAQQRQTYHHKDLRNALIETGIQLVSTEGVNAFSLRKVAAACGVSHAAPYSHFQNKEELLEAVLELLNSGPHAILIKASNFMKLYNIAAKLEEKVGKE